MLEVVNREREITWRIKWCGNLYHATLGGANVSVCGVQILFAPTQDGLVRCGSSTYQEEGLPNRVLMCNHCFYTLKDKRLI